MITHRTGNESDSTPVEVRIPCGAVTLEGALVIPSGANGVAATGATSASKSRGPSSRSTLKMVKTVSFKRLILRAVPPQVIPMLVRGPPTFCRSRRDAERAYAGGTVVDWNGVTFFPSICNFKIYSISQPISGLLQQLTGNRLSTGP